MYDISGVKVDETLTSNSPSGEPGYYKFGPWIIATDPGWKVVIDEFTLPSGIIFPTYDYDGIVTEHSAFVPKFYPGENFDIDFGYDDTPLLVELSSFTVEYLYNGVHCGWSTESEIENQGFILERRVKGESNWKEITSFLTNPYLQGQGSVTYRTNYEYLDKLVEANKTYEYRLSDVDYNGIVTHHSVRMVTVEKVLYNSKIDKFTLLPAYPNPFNPSTTITYGLDRESSVNIQIYNINGKLISTLNNTTQQQGWHSIEWNGTDLNNNNVPAGMYIGKITAGNEVRTTKLMLVK